MTDKLRTMPADLPALYYLTNFQTVLDWVGNRYGDLLTADEQQFLSDFYALDTDAQALFVRLVMRKRQIVRVSNLEYAEIAHCHLALTTLIQRGWVSSAIELSLDALFALATKAELLTDLAPLEVSQYGLHTRQSKSEMRASLEPLANDVRLWQDWLPNSQDELIALTCRALTDRIRLLFFGNPYQDWSTFVVADLGHTRYEQVLISTESRAFQTRIDIDTYDWLLSVQQRLVEGEAISNLWDALKEPVVGCSSVIAARQHKAQFQLGQAAEKQQDWPMAKEIYLACAYRSARYRLMRVHEKLAEWPEAYALAKAMMNAPGSEQERQSVERALPRLAKKCGEKPPAKITRLLVASEHTLMLAQAPDTSVEWAARNALASSVHDVFYVENTLFSGLFGLLYWPAIFAPIPGAFYHPYQSGPADLYHPEFAGKRADLLQRLSSALDSDDYRELIRRCYAEKYGIDNPFVVWGALTPELLERALTCLPAACLKAVFARLMTDIKINRSGFPDLIRMASTEALARGENPTFTLIEIKGPNDTLQDNQARWMDFFIRHDMSCQLLHVRWPV